MKKRLLFLAVTAFFFVHIPTDVYGHGTHCTHGHSHTIEKPSFHRDFVHDMKILSHFFNQHAVVTCCVLGCTVVVYLLYKKYMALEDNEIKSFCRE